VCLKNSSQGKFLNKDAELSQRNGFSHEHFILVMQIASALFLRSFRGAYFTFLFPFLHSVGCCTENLPLLEESGKRRKELTFS
jgi:hypothetical protein